MIRHTVRKGEIEGRVVKELYSARTRHCPLEITGTSARNTYRYNTQAVNELFILSLRESNALKCTVTSANCRRVRRGPTDISRVVQTFKVQGRGCERELKCYTVSTYITLIRYTPVIQLIFRNNVHRYIIYNFRFIIFEISIADIRYLNWFFLNCFMNVILR